MNKLLIPVILSIIILLGISTIYADEDDSVTVTTDKSSYSAGEIIIISGEVSERDGGTLVSVIVRTPIDSNGDNNIVSISQLEVDIDKKFSTIITAGGALMKTDGIYTVISQYGTENRSATTTFSFISNDSTPELESESIPEPSPIPETIPEQLPFPIPESEPFPMPEIKVEEELIPSWIKVIAGAWYNGELSDAEYVGAMEFLIEANIININGTKYDIMEAEALEWKSKYETAESQRVSQSQNDAAQHKILYDEKDEKYEKLKNDHDSMVKELNDDHDADKAEWKITYKEMSDEIEDLKKQLKEK